MAGAESGESCLVQGQLPSLCNLMGRKRQWVSGNPVIRALISFLRAPPSGPTLPSKAPLPSTTILGVAFQHTHFWGGHKHSMYSRGEKELLYCTET